MYIYFFLSFQVAGSQPSQSMSAPAHVNTGASECNQEAVVNAKKKKKGKGGSKTTQDIQVVLCLY